MEKKGSSFQARLIIPLQLMEKCGSIRHYSQLEEHFYSFHNTVSRALGNAHPVFHCPHILSHVKGKTKYISYPLVLDKGRGQRFKFCYITSSLKKNLFHTLAPHEGDINYQIFQPPKHWVLLSIARKIK